MTIQLNQSIPLNYRVPGIYMNFDFSTSGPSVPNKRVLFLGYGLAGAAGDPNTPQRTGSQSEADTLSGGRGTDLSRIYAAGNSQLRIGSGVEIWCARLIEPSGGTAATHLVWFRAPLVGSTSAVDTNTTAQAPGLITITHCGYPIPVGIQQGDDWNTIAASYLAATAPYQDSLPATPSIIGETVTIGTGNAAFSFTALDNPESVVVTQQVGVSQALTVNYAGGVLSIALGTDGASAASTTGTALKTALDGIAGLSTHIKYAFGGNGSGIIVTTLAQTLLPFACVVWTYRHKGLVSNDFPTRVNFSNTQMKVGVARAKITVTGSAANPAGAHTIQVNTGSFTHIPANSASASAEATALAQALNGQAFQVRAGYSSADVWLYYSPNRTVHKLQVSTVDTSQTLVVVDRVTSGALAGGTASSGSPVGLQGAGTPNLTAVLTAAQKLRAWVAWAHPFTDATSLGTIATHIEKYQDSPTDKGQTAHVCSTDKLTVAGALPGSSTPKLSVSPRYNVDILPGAWEQAHEYAARTACLVAQLIDYPPKNYDGQILVGSDTVPCHAPDDVELMSADDLQLAMASYGLTPLQPDADGNLSIVSDATTFQPGANSPLTRWGGILTMDYDRDDLKKDLRPVVAGKNIKEDVAYTPNCTRPENILDAVKAWMYDKGKLDIYDTPKDLFPQVQGAINPSNGSRYDLQLPMKWPRPLSVIGIRGFLAQ